MAKSTHTHSTSYDNQRYTWDVHRLWKLAKDLPVRDVSIESLTVLDRNCWFRKDQDPTVRRVVEHMQKALTVDLGHPIILNSDGTVMDGVHRIVRAMLDGHKTIKAVQFSEMPEPDSIEPLTTD